MALEAIKEFDWSVSESTLIPVYIPLSGETGQVELVAAVANKQIQGVGIMAGANTSTVYLLQSANNSIFPLLMSAGGGLVKRGKPLFATNEGEALNVTLSGDPGVNSGIYLQYRLK